jgi:hypothetical protein
VVVAVDWCEIRNDAHDRWRAALADAAGTSPDRVLVSSVHQHDAPLADLRADQILREAGAQARICSAEFHEKCVERTATALRRSLSSAVPIDHVGTGQAKVVGVGSNRRYVDASGVARFDRMSATRDAGIRDQPEGTIDPFLKSISFWRGDQPVAVVSSYSTHPMSYYATGRASSDFPGLARKRRSADDPKVFQMYLSGCSGNVTAGKFNDGSPANREVLADRIYRAMVEAQQSTRRSPIQEVGFRSVPYELPPRETDGYSVMDLKARLKSSDPKVQARAAMGLSWRERISHGKKLDLPVVDFGPALLALLPGESYVEYQLYAQQARPDRFVMAAGYGECATGYVPIERAWKERDGNLNDWCWVAPGAEPRLQQAIREALGPSSGR